MNAPAAATRRVPGPPGRLGLRNLARFTRDQLAMLRDVAQTYGDVARVELLGQAYYLVSHPDDVEAVLVKHARVMLRDRHSVVLERALGKGLLTSDGETWKRQRRLMAQAFVPRRIQSYGAAMAGVTDAGLRRWRDGAEINIHQEMSRLTMEVVADVLFGSGLTPEEVARVRDAMETVNEFFANSPEAVVLLPAWVPTPRNRRMNAAVASLDALIYQIIARRRAGEPRDDLLGTLLAAQGDDGARMTDGQLRDEAMTLFLAGHETTALALAHTLYLLSTHPEVAERLHAELDAVLGDRLPGAEDARALPFTERVLKESMRLYPPAGGFRIPKGAQILASPWVVQRDARWFPDPERFDPDRWEAQRGKEIPRFAYFPFGGGPRVCIGQHFAMLEATLMLAVIARRWRVALLPGQQLTFKPSVTLRQAGDGLRARLTARPGPAAR